MRLAVFSDIHGNAGAFWAMVEDVHSRRVDGYLYLGDTAGYYYDTRAVVQGLLSLSPLYQIRGNHDDLYARILMGETPPDDAVERYGHSYARTDPELARFFYDLPIQQQLSLDGHRVLITHGSPGEPMDGRIYPDTALDTPPPDVDYLLCGHTHYRMQRRWGGCTVINPGSLGQPRDGNGFSYCVVDFSTGAVQFHSIEMDLAPLLAQIDEMDAGHPYLKRILFRGRTGENR